MPGTNLPSWDDAVKNAQAAPPAPAPSALPSWDDAVKSAQPPAAAAAPTQPPWGSIMPGDTALQNWKPSGNAIEDWLMRPRGAIESPVGAMRDYGLAIGDSATAGLVAKTLGKGAQDTIAQAHQNLGPMDYIAQGVGYGAGPGKLLGPAARGIVGMAAPGVTATAAPLAARIAGSMATGGLESGVASGVNTYGHEAGWTPDAKEIGTSTALGTLYGMLPGVLGGSGPMRKGPTDADVGAPTKSGVPATGMYADKEAAYKPLQSTYFDQPSVVGPINQTTAAIRSEFDPGKMGVKLPISDEIRAQIKSVNQPVNTGYNIQKASSALRQIDNGNNPIAHRYADALDGTLNIAQPIPGKSMVNGAPAQIGDAGDAKAVGDMWHGRIKDLERLGSDSSNIPSGAVQQTMARPQNAPGTPAGDALLALSKAQQPSFDPYKLRHVIAPVAGAAVGGLEGYVNSAEGQDPWTNAAIHAGEDAMLFHGLKSAAAPRVSAPLNAARFAIGTGNPITTMTGRTGDALMNLLIGAGQKNTSPQ